MWRVSREKSDVLPRTSVATADRIFAALVAVVALVATAPLMIPCPQDDVVRMGGRGNDGWQAAQSGAAQ